MLKADSGPGRGALKLLARLRHLGFYLYPGVPNTTAISQETDINYSPFKSQFQRNLEEVVTERVLQGKLTSLQPWMAPLVVFGGKDEETGLVINQDESAFEVRFSCEMCKKAWAKVGVAPYTWACFTKTKVHQKLGDADDGMNALMISL